MSSYEADGKTNYKVQYLWANTDDNPDAPWEVQSEVEITDDADKTVPMHFFLVAGEDGQDHKLYEITQEKNCYR